MKYVPAILPTHTAAVWLTWISRRLIALGALGVLATLIVSIITEDGATQLAVFSLAVALLGFWLARAFATETTRHVRASETLDARDALSPRCGDLLYGAQASVEVPRQCSATTVALSPLSGKLRAPPARPTPRSDSPGLR